MQPLSALSMCSCTLAVSLPACNGAGSNVVALRVYVFRAAQVTCPAALWQPGGVCRLHIGSVH